MIIPDTSTPRPRGTVLPFAGRGRAEEAPGRDAPARPKRPLGDPARPV